MQRQHQIEVEQLLEEKERVLQEETNATIAGMNPISLCSLLSWVDGNKLRLSVSVSTQKAPFAYRVGQCTLMRVLVHSRLSGNVHSSPFFYFISALYRFTG